jgi:YHS domain-containing protein
MTRWILLAIALLLVVRLVLRFVYGLVQGLTGATDAAGGGARSRARAKVVGALVRDPVCGMYVPRDEAIEGRVGSETRYYCSEACRTKDAQAGRPQMGRAAHG